MKVAAQVLLTTAQAAKVFGVCERKFQQLRVNAWMPLPIDLGPRALRWVRSELEQAVLNMPRSSAPKEPSQLLRARIEKMKSRDSSSASSGSAG